MPPSPSIKPHFPRLKWKSQAGFQTATGGTCLYMRESMGSIIAGAIFGAVLGLGSIACGVWMLMTQRELSGRGFGVFVVLIGIFFVFLLWTTARRGRWMIVYDRGEAGRPGEIRFADKRIAANQVRAIATQPTGGNPPRQTVTAELHDGTVISLGPVGLSTWPYHWAYQAATWMNLPYRGPTA